MKTFSFLILTLISHISLQETKEEVHWTIYNTKCESKCERQKSGLFMCTLKDDNAKEVYLECFNPIDLKKILQDTNVIKSNVAPQISVWSAKAQAVNDNLDGINALLKKAQNKLAQFNTNVDMIELNEHEVSASYNELWTANNSIIKTKEQISQISRDYDKKLFTNEHNKKEHIKVTDCYGLNGYQSGIEGDGLTGHYYNNEMFYKDFEVRVDKHIEFFWNDESPIPNVINASNFSIRWKGYIKVPQTARYKFKLDTDDGGVLILNGSPIIKDNMEDKPFYDWLMFQLREFHHYVKINEYKEYLNVFNSMPRKNKSAWVELEAHQFYEIEIHYIHTVHNTTHESPQAWVNLQYDSDELAEMVVPRYYLYTEVRQELIKLNNFNPMKFSVDYVVNYGEAFVDTMYWRVYDLPEMLHNSIRLKTYTEFSERIVQFDVNIPVTVYFAYDWNESDVLDSQWLQTTHQMSLLKLNLENYNHLIKYGHGDAVDQIDMCLYKQAFGPGTVKFRVNVPKDSFLLVQMYIVEDMGAKNLSCAGEEFNLTKKFLQKCESSSHLAKYDCYAGMSGEFKDVEDHMFHFDSQSKGGWVKVDFSDMVKPTYLRIMQPADFVDMVQTVRIHYNKHLSEVVQLRDSNTEQLIPLLNSYPTAGLKLEVEATYGARNNGFAFELLGYECLDPKEANLAEDKKFEQEYEDPVKFLECNSTLDGALQDLKPDHNVSVICEESCQWETDYTFWGNATYTGHSSLCRAAFYEGLTDEDGGMFKVEKKAGQSEYKAGPFRKESCNPEDHADHPTSFVLLGMANDSSLANIKYRELQDVDYKVRSTNSQANNKECWFRGQVESILKATQTEIKVYVPSKNKTFTVAYPSAEYNFDLAPCGSMLGTPCEHAQLPADDMEAVLHEIQAKTASDIAQRQHVKQYELCGSYRHGDCLKNPGNCIFERAELDTLETKCTGDFILLDLANASDLRSDCQLLQCMYKCIKITFPTEFECSIVCPFKNCKKQDDGLYSCLQ